MVTKTSRIRVQEGIRVFRSGHSIDILLNDVQHPKDGKCGYADVEVVLGEANVPVRVPYTGGEKKRLEIFPGLEIAISPVYGRGKTIIVRTYTELEHGFLYRTNGQINFREVR